MYHYQGIFASLIYDEYLGSGVKSFKADLGF